MRLARALGLPQGSKLSSGRPYDETEWSLKPDEIGDLHLVLPSNASGESKLIIQLVAIDGAILADAATILKVPTNSAANIPTSMLRLSQRRRKSQCSVPKGLRTRVLRELPRIRRRKRNAWRSSTITN